MSKVYYDKDVKADLIQNKIIAVLGYGSQGEAQAKNLRDSNLKVILGLRKNGSSWRKAEKEGFEVFEFSDAAKRADMIQFLIPDEYHKDIYDQISEYITTGKTLICSHGFNFHFKRIIPPENIDVIMIAPKAPGPLLREEYEKGFGVPALIAVFQDYSGRAKQKALAYAKAIGSTRVGVLETTFKIEVETDLFGEQHVLCGGIVELMKAGFETLVNAGYPTEAAYFECVHEMKLIVDLIYKDGIKGMYNKVSNTAKYGGLTRGKNVITSEVRKNMRKGLEDIQTGKFAKEWIKEFTKLKVYNLKLMMDEIDDWQMEKTGRKIRRLAGLES